MTKCGKNEVNLKSTAYNQRGENIFVQLSAYDSMSSHLRRILLAKSVVDAKNKLYVGKRKQQTCKLANCESGILKKDLTDHLIDRIAYDSLHHPADILRMCSDSKYPSQREVKKHCINRYVSEDVMCPRSRVQDQSYYEESNRVSSRSRRASRNYQLPPYVSNNQQSNHRDPFVESSISYGKKIKSVDAKIALKVQDRLSERRYEENLSDESDSVFNLRLSTASGLSRNYEDHEPSRSSGSKSVDEKSSRAENEEAKYAEFVYEITREIMLNGLYTDQELQDVFRKHLEKNEGVLNMSKMLYEIYQLKMSLNVSDDSDDSDDDELEHLIHTQQLLRIPEIRPPTPPKVLNENKIIDKLMSYQMIIDGKLRSRGESTKTVVLVDANPELLVTERDVLLSLMEANVDPKQAEQICKSLFHKSKNTLLANKVQVEEEEGANSGNTTVEDAPTYDSMEKTIDTAETSERGTSSLVSDQTSTEDKNVGTKEHEGE